MLWVWRVPPLGDTTLTECLPILSASEQALYLTIKSPRRRREYLAGHYLLRVALTHLLPDWAEQHTFELDDENWLSLTGPAASCIDFNLSHSGEWVACAVGYNCRLGVDIESPRKQRSYRELAAEYFSEGECRRLDALSDEECREAFFELWTLKESYLKARKQGISAAELATEFLPITDSAAVDWCSYRFQFSQQGDSEAGDERVFGALTVSALMSEPLEVQQFSLGKPLKPLVPVLLEPLVPRRP